MHAAAIWLQLCGDTGGTLAPAPMVSASPDHRASRLHGTACFSFVRRAERWATPFPPPCRPAGELVLAVAIAEDGEEPSAEYGKRNWRLTRPRPVEAAHGHEAPSTICRLPASTCLRKDWGSCTRPRGTIDDLPTSAASRKIVEGR